MKRWPCGTANAAWEILRSADSPPLALLDWMMPALSGVELCCKVRQESEAPFVLSGPVDR